MPDDDLGIQGLLRECTVRVEVNKQHVGTGFFVAPGTVVTCAHVMQSARLASVAEPEIAVVPGSAKPLLADLTEVWDEEVIDLAILKLKQPYEHFCALLDSEFRVRDEVDSFGYPEKYPDGVPRTFSVEGEMGGEGRWVELKGGQVQEGMSGGGVINNRTGAVFGVLKRSRDPRVDLGGYAVPIATLYRLQPQLEGENERAHAKDPRWVDLLPPEVRRLRRASQRARPAETAPDSMFVINVGQTATGWQVTADVHPAGEVIGPAPIDLNSVRQKVARLFRDWASRGRVQQQGGEIALLGSILFDALFPGEIGTRFADLRQTQTRVAVALRFDEGTDADLIQLPWEHLYYEDGGQRRVCLARDGSATFSRVLERETAPVGLPHRRALKVLVVAVRPQWEGDDAAKVEQVDETVKRLKEIATKVGAVDLVPMEEDAPDVFALGEAATGYDVIHYLGFGRFTGDVDELVLGGDGESGIVPVELGELADSLSRGDPQLVVLQLLKGRASDVPADFSILAPSLMELAQDIPAVIASQYPVDPRAASKFNETLYEQLGRGTSVDVAVQEARSKLAWGRLSVSHALFLRRPGELRLTAPGRDVVQPPATGAYSGYG
jgi:hypothetical protein